MGPRVCVNARCEHRPMNDQGSPPWLDNPACLSMSCPMAKNRSNQPFKTIYLLLLSPCPFQPMADELVNPSCNLDSGSRTMPYSCPFTVELTSPCPCGFFHIALVQGMLLLGASARTLPVLQQDPSGRLAYSLAKAKSSLM